MTNCSGSVIGNARSNNSFKRLDASALLKLSRGEFVYSSNIFPCFLCSMSQFVCRIFYCAKRQGTVSFALSAGLLFTDSNTYKPFWTFTIVLQCSFEDGAVRYGKGAGKAFASLVPAFTFTMIVQSLWYGSHLWWQFGSHRWWQFAVRICQMLPSVLWAIRSFRKSECLHLYRIACSIWSH